MTDGENGGRSAGWRGATSLLLLLTIGAGAAFLPVDARGRARDLPPVAALLPPETVLHVSFEGRGLGAALRRLALVRTISEPDLSPLRQALGQWLSRLRRESTARLTGLLGFGLDEILDLAQARWTVSVLGLDQPLLRDLARGTRLAPDLVLSAEYADSMVAARRVLIAFQELFLAEDLGVFKDEVLGGLAVKHFAGQRLPLDLWYVVQGRLFLLGTNRQSFRQVLERLKSGGRGDSLASAGNFQRIRSQVQGQDAALFAYGSGALAAELVPWVQEQLPSAGLISHLIRGRSFGVGVGLQAGGVRERLFLAGRPQSSGQRAPVLKSPMPGAAALAPRRSVLFASAALDLSLGLEAARSELENLPWLAGLLKLGLSRAQTFLGGQGVEELLRHLGPELSVCSVFTGQSLIPQVALLVQVRDKAWMADLLRGLDSQQGQAIQHQRAGSLEISSWAGPEGVPGAGFRPALSPRVAWSLVGDYLVLAPWPEVIRQLQRDRAGATPGLAAASDFAHLMGRLQRHSGPAERLTGVLYADLVPLAGMLLDTLTPVIQSTLPALWGADPAAVWPPSELLTRHLFGALALRWSTPSGVLWDSYSPLGVTPLAGALVLATGAWLLAR